MSCDLLFFAKKILVWCGTLYIYRYLRLLLRYIITVYILDSFLCQSRWRPSRGDGRQ